MSIPVEDRKVTITYTTTVRGDRYNWIALSNTTLGILMVTINTGSGLLEVGDLTASEVGAGLMVDD